MRIFSHMATALCGKLPHSRRSHWAKIRISKHNLPFIHLLHAVWNTRDDFKRDSPEFFFKKLGMGTLNLLKPREKIRDNPEQKPAEQGKYSFSLVVEIDILQGFFFGDFSANRKQQLGRTMSFWAFSWVFCPFSLVFLEFFGKNLPDDVIVT